MWGWCGVCRSKVKSRLGSMVIENIELGFSSEFMPFFSLGAFILVGLDMTAGHNKLGVEILDGIQCGGNGAKEVVIILDAEGRVGDNLVDQPVDIGNCAFVITPVGSKFGDRLQQVRGKDRTVVFKESVNEPEGSKATKPFRAAGASLVGRSMDPALTPPEDSVGGGNGPVIGRLVMPVHRGITVDVQWDTGMEAQEEGIGPVILAVEAW